MSCFFILFSLTSSQSCILYTNKIWSVRFVGASKELLRYTISWCISKDSDYVCGSCCLVLIRSATTSTNIVRIFWLVHTYTLLVRKEWRKWWSYYSITEMFWTFQEAGRYGTSLQDTDLSKGHQQTRQQF